MGRTFLAEDYDVTVHFTSDLLDIKRQNFITLSY